MNLATFQEQSLVPEFKQPTHSASLSILFGLIMRRGHVFIEWERPRFAPANVL